MSDISDASEIYHQHIRRVFKEKDMEWIGRPPYNRECVIRTEDGAEYRAKLIRLNPRYHTRVKDLDVWRREGDIPKKERYIQPGKVIGWTEL